MIDSSMKAFSPLSAQPAAAETAKKIKQAPTSQQVATQVEHRIPLSEPVQAGTSGGRAQDKRGSQDTAYLEKLAASATESANRAARDIEFSVDKDTERLVIKVVDRQTQQVIRQLPPEEMLDLMKKMENLQGVIFRDEV